ncbi:MAG: hypothetical protein KIS73_26990 [Enhydrobacter sp.]|nr:hypothetical protein [Enhydrobacter sp.]
MTPDNFFARIVEPTLAYMAASPSINVPVTDGARVLVMSIAGQESFWKERRQIGGPARGFWQFEFGGGIDDVFRVTPRQLGTVCASLDIPYDRTVVFEAMAWNDTLACAMARLLLWMQPPALPAIGDKEGAWQYYLKAWRPGAPHRHTWDARYDTALKAAGL